MKGQITKTIFVRKSTMDDIYRPVKFFVNPDMNTGKKNTRPSNTSISIAVVLLFALSLGLTMTSSTNAYFNDTENSLANSLRAGALDFTVATDGSVDAYVGLESMGGKTVIPVLTPEPGSFPVDFTITAKRTGGDAQFCDSLVASATSSPLIYNGPLISLSSATTTTSGPWQLAISLPQNSVGIKQGDTCSVDLVYTGWATGQDGVGYLDIETVSLTLRARLIVLNEFLPNPEGIDFGFDFGQDADLQPRGEWIELYNNSTSSVDLLGWSVGNNNTAIPITALNTIPSGTVIGPNSWMTVYLNQALLDNTIDAVRLIDPASHVVDSYVYSGSTFCTLEPSPDTTNVTVPSGSCPIISGNKSFARIPDGIGAWVDPVPTPGFANSIQSDAALQNPITPEVVQEEILQNNVIVPQEQTTEPHIEQIEEKDDASTPSEVPLVIVDLEQQEQSEQQTVEESIVETPTLVVPLSDDVVPPSEVSPQSIPEIVPPSE